MKKSYLLLVLLTFLCIESYGQASTCANADPFCAGGSALTFPNTTNAGQAEPGIDYACLFSQPNPAWFYLQISVPGQLNFFISQSNASGSGIDVDFIAWGPFAAPTCGSANLNPSTQIACSFSAAPTESFTINNAQVGQVYMLLLTNYSNQSGQISLTQTNSGAPGAGATDCNIVCPLSILGAAPPCPSTILTAQYLNASAPTFQWYNASGPISGATGATYTTTVPGDYTVVANSPGCYANASATVTVPAPTPAPVTQPPATLTACGNGTAIFNLNQNNEAAMGLDANDFTINGYYNSQANAQSGIAPIGSPGSFSGTDGQVVYLAIEDNNGGCITVLSFALDVIDCGPIPPDDQVVCDDPSNNGTETFDLASLIPGILGTEHSPADYTVTFHTSQTAADAGTGAISPANAYVGGPNQTIYIRMEENTTGLYGTATFQLIVLPVPATPNPADVTVCDSYQLPTLPGGQTYHAGTAAGPVIPAGTNITTTQTIVIVAESGTNPNCVSSGDFLVTINNTPPAPTPTNVTQCDSYSLPALPPGQTYHSGSPTGPVMAVGTVITSTQEIHVVASSGTTPDCTSSASFTVTIYPTPPAPTPANVTVCDSYVLPALPTGQTYHAGTATGPVIVPNTPITTTQTIVIVAESGTTPNCTSEGSFVVTIIPTPPTPNPSDVAVCDSYSLPALEAGQTYHEGTATGPVLAEGSVITTTTTIFIVAESGTTPNCSTNGKFLVTINPTPVAPNPADVAVCDSYELPALPPGQTYHAGSASGPVIPVGTLITTTQTIVVVAETSSAPFCSSEGDFVVTIYNTPDVPNPADVTACDSYVLPDLPDGQTYHAGTATGAIIPEGTAITTTQTIVIVAETGTTPNCSVSGDFVVTINQTPPTPNPADVTVCDVYVLPALGPNQTYHAGSATGPVIAEGTPITTTQTIVVVAETGTTPNCVTEGDFVVTVNPTPVAEDPADVVACDSYVLPFLNVGSYFTGPNGTGTQHFGGDVITAAHTTLYVYAETGTTPNCTSENSFDIDIFFSPTIAHPDDIRVCDDNNDGFSCLFVLSDRDAQITGGNPALTVTYHETDTDALTGANPIASVGGYCNIVAGQQTLHVRVFDPAAPLCASVETLELYVDPVPVPNPVIPDYRLCDDNDPGDLLETFDLTTMDAVILNGQTGVDVTYYLTSADATAGINPIANPSAFQNTTAGTQQICARLENAASGCFAVACFNLVVDPLPAATASAMNACGSASGVATFNLTTQDLTVSGGVPGMAVSYYLDAAATTAIDTPMAFENTTNPQTVYAVVTNTTTGCTATATVTLTVSQGPPATTPARLEVCDPNNDCFAPFNLNDAMSGIVGAPTPPAGITVTFHETLTDAQNGQTAIANPGSYTNIVACDQVLYVSVAYDATGCRTVVELALHVNLTPQATEIPALEVCDDDTDGIGTFDLNAAIPSILGSLDASNHTVTFYATQADAQAPTNQITNVLGYHNTTPNAQIIWVRVEDNTTHCFDVIELELVVNRKPLLPPTATGAAEPYTLCDINSPGDEREEFDLSTRIPGIVNGQMGITVTFHLTQAEALAPSGALPNLYINTANAQTLWVRMEDQLTGCYVLTTMDLRVEPLPVLIPPSAEDTTLCDADGDGFALFDLDSLTADMLQGAPNIDVTFHETMTDALNGNNPLASPYLNIVAYLQPVYVAAENTLTGCRSVMMIELHAVPSPVVPPLEDIAQCDTDANNQDGFSIFDLTIHEALILNNQTGPGSDYQITYHQSQADAESGANPIVGPSAYHNTVSYDQTIWVRVAGTGSGCANVGSFEIHVDEPLALVTPTQLTVCDDGPTSALPQAVFDLTIRDAEITGGAAGYTVSYYETQADALADTNAIANPQAYTNIANAQTLFVAVKGPAPSFCRSFTTLTIRVLPLPVPVTTDIPVIELCDDNAPSGTEAFDLTLNEDYIRDNDPQLHFEYYTTLAAAQAGDDTAAEYINDPVAHEMGSGTVYIRVERITEPDYQGEYCYVIVEQQVVLNALPDVQSADAQGCDTSGTGAVTATFDLSASNIAVLVSGDVSDYTFTYYPSLADAQAGTGQLPNSYLGTDGQVLGVKIVNNATGCVAYAELTLHVVQGAIAPTGPITIAPMCADNTDGTAAITLADYDPEMLGATQTAPDFSVAYFASLADAQANTGALAGPTHDMANGSLYAVVTNNNTGCRSTVTRIDFSVESLIVIGIESDTEDGISNTICVNADATVLQSGLTLLSGLPNDGTYQIQWYHNGDPAPGVSNAPSYTISDVNGHGAYTVTATSALGCVSTSEVFNVVRGGQAELVEYFVSDYFADEHTITVVVNGQGTYHYQLDDGPIVDNGGIFTNVPRTNNDGQPHTVTVWDVTGDGAEHCDPLEVGPIQIIDYPKFFTPNGDGINDTWIIRGLDDSAKIYIFDRYGKLVKQIASSGQGWDGTYNGQPMPSTDYWFTVEYNEPNSTTVITKEFKAHFSLKR